jgi:hydroxyacylglutathione hydrolase
MLYRSLTERLLALPDHLVLYPSHYSGSVCGRGLSANPSSTIGFERRHNTALQFDSEDAFVGALLKDIPPAPPQQADIVAANRAGHAVAETG